MLSRSPAYNCRDSEQRPLTSGIERDIKSGHSTIPRGWAAWRERCGAPPTRVAMINLTDQLTGAGQRRRGKRRPVTVTGGTGQQLVHSQQLQPLHSNRLRDSEPRVLSHAAIRDHRDPSLLSIVCRYRSRVLDVSVPSSRRREGRPIVRILGIVCVVKEGPAGGALRKRPRVHSSPRPSLQPKYLGPPR